MVPVAMLGTTLLACNRSQGSLLRFDYYIIMHCRRIKRLKVVGFITQCQLDWASNSERWRDYKFIRLHMRPLRVGYLMITIANF